MSSVIPFPNPSAPTVTTLQSPSTIGGAQLNGNPSGFGAGSLQISNGGASSSNEAVVVGATDGTGNAWVRVTSPSQSWEATKSDFSATIPVQAQNFQTNVAGNGAPTIFFQNNGVGGPNLATGTGAPTYTANPGSLFLRTDGAANSRLYISLGSGSWAAVTST